MEFDPHKMSWGHQYYNIPFLWDDMQYAGKGVTVAVIDTGIDIHHQDLKAAIHPRSRSFLKTTDDISDNTGHGTKMGGIIAARGTGVFGVAPKASILVLKASETDRAADPKIHATALRYAAGIPEIDIISVSTAFYKREPSLSDAISECIAAGKIVVAAIGNGRDVIGRPEGPDRDTFPACYDNVLAIGAFDNTGKICLFSNWHPQLSFLAPGDHEVLTAGPNNSTVFASGTSIATAFTSGCLALLLSYTKKHGLPNHASADTLVSTCDDTGPYVGRDICSGFGLMNLRNAFAKLKSL